MSGLILETMVSIEFFFSPNYDMAITGAVIGAIFVICNSIFKQFNHTVYINIVLKGK